MVKMRERLEITIVRQHYTNTCCASRSNASIVTFPIAATKSLMFAAESGRLFNTCGKTNNTRVNGNMPTRKKKNRVNAKTPQTCSATPTTARKGNVQLCLSSNPYHPYSRYGPSLSCNTVVLYIPGNFNNRRDVTPPLVYSRSLLNCELKVFLPQQIFLLLSECAIDGIIP